jgi:hypothetical protein
MFVLALLLKVLSIQQLQPEIIDGYTDKLSVYPGDSLDLYLNSSFSSEEYTLKLFDLSGKISHNFKATVSPQSKRSEKSYELGFGYKRTCRIVTPDIRSGIYLFENKIPIIVKSRESKITIVYPSNTINAYCASGGKSLYGFNSSENKGAQVVSFHRPMGLPRHAESFLRWVHAEGNADIGYIGDVDLQDFKSINKSKLLIIAGHSEYWTVQARRNFDRFVNSGKHAMVLSGNTMWWQVRYNKTNDQLICYRDAKSDPINNEKLKTINWFEPSLGYPITSSIGAEFRNAGYGLKFFDGGWDGYKIISDSPLLEGTSIKKNDIIKCPSDETDGAPLAGLQDSMPVIDYAKANFDRIEIVGYDRVQWAGREGIATWIVFRPTSASGIVINTVSTDWCSHRGIGSNEDIKTIVRTMIRKLMNDENVFSNDINQSAVSNQ